MIDFWGRENGAIGANSHYTRIIEADSKEAAHLKLYDTHEHIGSYSIEAIGPKEKDADRIE